jgi:tryptophan 2,3-dioxygenase/predicted transcriptional regulator
MVALISEASRAVQHDRPAEAAALIRAAATTLDEARPLFSLMGTMRREAFCAFRTYTEGASAIQSANYKRFEALCAKPRPERLDSDAFRSVPEVRANVLDGKYAPVQDVVAEAVDSGRWQPASANEVREAALQLEDVHARWKQTHYRLAMRMIGDRPGTGYTSGTPYLRSVLENRLFAQWRQPPAEPPRQVLARDVMNTAPVTISEDADVRQAVDLVVSGRASDLMVLGADGRFAGLLAEGDILRRALPDRDEILAAGGTVDDAYRVFLRRGMELAGESIKPMIIRRPVLVRPDDHVGKLATILVERHMRTLAVVDGDRLVGSLSRGDVCRALVGAR